MNDRELRSMALVAWIDTQEAGVTSTEISLWGGWKQQSLYVQSILSSLRSKQLLCLNGRAAAARWCTPRHLANVQALHAAAVNKTRERNKESARRHYAVSNKSKSRANVPEPTCVTEIPKRLVEHAGRLVAVPNVARSVFDLAA